jgi:hypothetical protein
MGDDERVPHFASLAKYAVAFLRNSEVLPTGSLLQNETKRLGAEL